jgi:hypothetical protein
MRSRTIGRTAWRSRQRSPSISTSPKRKRTSGNLDDVESRAHRGFAAGERAGHSHARVDAIPMIVKPNVVYVQQRTLDADEFRRVDLVTCGVMLAAVMLASTLR